MAGVSLLSLFLYTQGALILSPHPLPRSMNGYEETYQNLTKSGGGGEGQLQLQLQYTSTVAPTQGE